ncbi:MAG: GNAT family N-acetyltransferase [Acidimicrobiia bacterium]|nr:GNAT family N-acetyltransferase [Acidimicrobiia bacterium]MDH4307680.1 GNAT family N-acetyltransferase [Acidimicrobiia bacterium]
MTESLVEVDPTTDRRWAVLVAERSSDVFHSPEWLAVLAETYGFEVRARLLMEGESPIAGFAFVEVGDMMDRRTVSLPFSDFCDPIIDTPDQWRSLTDGLVEGRFQVKCLRTSVPVEDERLTEVGRLKWHAVDTTRAVDDVWGSLDPSARRAIRKAEAAGIEIREAESLADLEAFFALHVRLRKYKYHLLAQPFDFFEQIWMRFIARGRGSLLLATVESDVVGGVLFLEWKDTFYYKFNASDPDRLDVRPNDLVVWSGIKAAHDRGLQWLDFGVSDLDQEGLIRYKRKYASRESEVVVVRSPAGPSAREADARRLLGGLTNLLVAPDVSDEVSRNAGQLLYRYFV